MSSNENEDPAQIAMRVRGANGQTANLFVVETYDGTDKFVVDKDGDITATGDFALTGTYTHTGDLDVVGNLSVSVAATLPAITGPTTLTGTLGVTGAATLPAITGPTTLTGDLAISGEISYGTKANDPALADYIVWNSGGTYYARNCWTGAIDYSGTSPNVVVESCETALGEDAGKIVLLSGDYTLTAAIDYVDDIVIEGMGRTTRIIVPAEVTSGAFLAGDGGTTPRSGITLRNLLIDCGAQTSGGAVLFNKDVTDSLIENIDVIDCPGDCITLNYNSDRCTIQNCHLETTDGSGVHVFESDDVKVLNNWVKGTATADRGISIYPNDTTGVSSHRVNVSGNHCTGFTADIGYGIYLYGSDGGTVLGNHCYGNRHGIYFNSKAVYFTGRNNTVTANHCYDNVEYGMYLGNPGYGRVYDCTLTANVCERNGRDGIYVNFAESCSLTANICNNNSQALGNRAGIWLEANAVRCILTANVCTDTQAEATQAIGIVINGANCLDNMLVGNIVKGNTYVQYLNSGTRTVVQHMGGEAYELEGLGTIPSGLATVQITHGLVTTPSKVWLTGKDSKEMSAIWYEAGGTVVQVYVPANVTADRYFSYRFSVF